MSEPVAERLSRFTPDSSGLDRDALLFAAGRAAARPERRWLAVAGGLAASQLVTLLLLWPRTPPSVAVVSPGPVSGEASVAPPPSSWRALGEQILAGDGDLPAAQIDDALVPAEPTWRAFAAPPAALFN
jgi:hypothetical protein